MTNTLYLNSANKAKPCCRIRPKKVESPNEKYSKKRGKKQPKIKTQMNGNGLTVHAGLLPVLTFMEKLLFRRRAQEAVRKERGANARYQIVDAMQMVVIGLIAGATSMVQIVKVWSRY